MFLQTLSNNEKQAFWCIANDMILADEVLAEQEKDFLNIYQQEMQLKDAPVLLTWTEALQLFDKSSTITKKQVYVELYALADCDGEIAKTERDMLSALADKFGINSQKAEELEACIQELKIAYQKIETALYE